MSTTERDSALQERLSRLTPRQRALLAKRLDKNAPQQGHAYAPVRALARPRERFHLSHSQERLWFLDQLAPGNPAYNISTAVPLRLRLNVRALERALNEIVRRHEALRTTFIVDEGVPWQVVSEPADRPLETMVLTDRPEHERAELVTRLANEEAARPFDLATGPLIRWRLLTSDDTNHVLMICMHHIVSDGWSMGIFFDELTQLYAGFSMGRPSPLAALEVQYGDFAEWQREHLSGDELDRQVEFWRTKLADLEPLDLPLDRPRPSFPSQRGGYVGVHVPVHLTAKLKQLGVSEGVTLFMTLLACFNALLHRYTSQTDFAVGTYIANRTRRELEQLIGFFINTLVMRVDLHGDPTVRELIGRVNGCAVQAYAHQDIPFPTLVQELHPDRDLSLNPLFQVVFHLFNTPTSAIGTADANDHDLPKIERHTAIFDLVFELTEHSGALIGGLEYNSDIFDHQSIERFARHFVTLLECVAANPDQRLSRLGFLQPAERRTLLVNWNGAERELAWHSGIAGLFDQQVAAAPHALAVVTEHGEMSFAELADRSNRLFHHLKAAGCGRRDWVAIAMSRSADAIAAMLAVLKLGAAFIPLDPRYPSERLRFILEDSEARFLMTTREAPAFSTAGAVHTIHLDDDDAAIAARPATVPPLDFQIDDPAYIFYTSGSTGRPKGIVNSQRQLLNRLHWMWREYPFADDDIQCHKTALTFIDSLWEIFGTLPKGVPIVIPSDDVVKDPRALVPLLARTGVTRLWLVPSLLSALLEAYPDLGLQVPRLRFWVSSGEALTADLYRQFRETHPAATLYNLYGTSEAWDVTWLDPDPDEEFQWRVPIGRPITNTRAYVLDAHLQPVPAGVAGELFVGGACLPLGYVNRPELESERIVSDPFSDEPNAKLHRTGDLVRFLANGRIEYVRRMDHQVKIRGHRVELGELEEVLCEHPGVGAAAATLKGDLGEAPRLVAYVVQDADYRGGVAGDHRDWLAEKVVQWQDVWDDAYSQSGESGDPTFNASGFSSSFSGEPIAEVEVREWVDNAVVRTLRLQPRRVLELGCGAGMLLFRIAPSCDRYVGSDFSAAALAAARPSVKRLGLDHVELVEGPADDLTRLHAESFDTIVVHSVAQYFPSADYFERVLGTCLENLAESGALYLGDVRSLPLLSDFHLAVLCHKEGEALRTAAVGPALRRRLAAEQELAIDPLYFHQLHRRYPRLAETRIELKRGAIANEFTRFRYDVTMRLDGRRSEASVRELDWELGHMTMDMLGERIGSLGDETLIVRGIPNARVAAPHAVLRLLDDPAVDVDASLTELWAQGAGDTVSAVDPEALARAGEQLGFDVNLMWAGPGRDDVFDAVLRRRDSYDPCDILPAIVSDDRDRPSRSLFNNPLQGLFLERLVPELKRYLAQRLPEAAIPNQFVLMERFPLTPSGKLDRKALPDPDRQRRDDRPLVPPRTETERALVRLWEDLLNLSGIGIDDDFFADLGGHSLLATQLVSRIRSRLDIEVPLRSVFEQPTVRTLCAVIDRLGPQPTQSRGTIQRISRDRYRAGGDADPTAAIGPAADR